MILQGSKQGSCPSRLSFASRYSPVQVTTSRLRSSGLSSCRTCRRPYCEYFKEMNHPWVLLFFAVCVLWTLGETGPCDLCGRECANICGTRQFRACCFNNVRKRHSDSFGLKFWMRPRRYALLYPAYDD
ncbi:uncharacterized protein LOC105197468 [Solenopsis invicta]|uniref:uncharacterized protein LOC105197468 n=1 Tax=Solenopsis invicta TaxID=13686 RepID=UPI000595FD38|nr:uncharacterized protein LOC105197468 [Solenopsis invicta]